MRYTAVYRVFTDDAQDQAQTVLQYVVDNIAALGSEYSYAGDTAATTARLRDVRAERELGSAFVWNAVLQYEPPAQTDGLDSSGNEVTNPLNFRPDVSVRTEQYQRPFRLAVYEGGFRGFMGELREKGELIVPHSSSMIPVEPPLHGDDARLSVTVTRNLATYDASDDDEQANSVNAFPFRISAQGLVVRIEAKTAKIRGTSVGFRRSNGVDYLQVTKTFDRDRFGWIEEVPDMGVVRRALPGDPASDVAGGEDLPAGDPGVRAILDADGEPVNEPVWLDGDGEPLANADPIGMNPINIKWRKYREINFKAISFFDGVII